jgi:hypothetical protein
MPTRRRSTAAAIALTAGITAGAALLLSACGPDDPTAGSSPSATSTNTASGAAGSGKGGGSVNGKGADGATAPAANAKPAGSSAPANGTAHNGLTISDGTRYVVMNGTRVDFGTQVRDLSWSPGGAKAAFIDGAGDLAVSKPDGSGRTVVAENPGGQTWSHPTWQVRPADSQDGLPALNNILFAVNAGGTSKLYGVTATAHNGTPKVLTLGHESGEDVKSLPQTGNTWPSAAGSYGGATYANPGTGEVYIRDDYLRQQGSALTPGSEPAMSPAEDEDIVFVRSVSGHDHLFVEHSTDSGPTYKDLTPAATTNYAEPAWSPDGKTIAARTPAGIVTLPANGSAAPTEVSGYQGLPAYRAS